MVRHARGQHTTDAARSQDLHRLEEGSRRPAGLTPEGGVMDLSRRDLLKLGVVGSAALLLPLERFARTEVALRNRLSTAQLPARFTQALPVAAPIAPTAISASGGHVHHFYDMRMRENGADILGNGKLTKVWGYNGITPGPTISVPQGVQTVVRHYNNLEGVNHPTLGYKPVTSVHLHGSCSLPEYDGYASDVTEPGWFKDYHYPNCQDARTLWYHDHGVHETASNAYMGLAAQYHLHDANEARLVSSGGLPSAAYDVPLTIRDAIFSTSGQLIYDDNSQSQDRKSVV